MGILECPLCCAENFPDETSLQDHLLNLSDNIVCPVCEVQFKTIRSLAVHLGGECKQLSSEVLEDVCGLKSKAQAEPSVSEVLDQTENVNSTIGSCIQNEIQVSDKDDGYALVTFLNENVISNNENAMSEKKLYSCSVCNVTFMSIEDHLLEYHLDEYVFVDDSVSEECQSTMKKQNKNNSEDVDRVTSGDPPVNETCPNIGEYMMPDSSSIVWPRDDFKNIMLENWTPEDSLQSQNNKISNSKHCYVVMPSLERSNQARWVNTAEGFFYAADDKKSQELQLRMSYENSALESAVRTITEEENEFSNYCGFWNDWPEDVKMLPLATFLSIDSDLIYGNNDGHNSSSTIERKSYTYKDHKVRVVRVKCKIGSPPSLEDVPFPEKPPDGLFPVLEPAVNTPDDLVGTIAVMWPCQLCGHLELHWSSLANHKCSVSLENRMSTHKCSICSKCFQSKRLLTNHFNLAHRDSQQALGMKIQCEICSARVHTSSHLEKHMAMHRKNDLVKCEECKCMVQKSTFEQHVKAHAKNGTLSLVCWLCNRPFKGETELHLHIPQCHLQDQELFKLQCLFCQKMFTDVVTLREHLVTHNILIKNHCCQFCPKSFNRLIDKVIHERVHTKSKPYECKECGRCFRLRNSLVTHMRIHSGERPFSCSSCDKAFRTKHLLRIHSATHLKTMQIKCSFCSKMFKCRERAKIHENLHKKPYSCEECGRTFHSFGFMRKHRDCHKKGSLVYKCNMCSFMFLRAAFLESHLVNEHGLDSATSIKISCKNTFEHMKANLDAGLNADPKL